MDFRFFKVTAGPLMDELHRIHQSRQTAYAALKKFAKEMGASGVMTADRRGFCGLAFDPPPDPAVWKKVSDNCYWPKRNTKAGRELHKRMRALPVMESHSRALRVVGLDGGGFPVLLEGRYGYCNTLFGNIVDGPVFIRVPWRHVSDQELAEYRREREAGTRWCASLSHLSWQPHESMAEVKEWEVLRYLDEAADEAED